MSRRSTRLDEYMRVAADLQSLRQTLGKQLRRVMGSKQPPYPVLRNRHNHRNAELLKLFGSPLPKPIEQPCDHWLPAATLCRKNSVAHDVAVFCRSENAFEPKAVATAVAAAIGRLDVRANRGRATQAIPFDLRKSREAFGTRYGASGLDQQIGPAERTRFRQDHIPNRFHGGTEWIA